jgi:hypothetical protein
MVSADGRGLVSQAGAVLLWETMRVTGLGRGLSEGLARWRAPRAVHDPGKVVADLAAAVALGGDCLADIALLREQPELAGPVASDPVVSRLVSQLAADVPRALKAIRSARAAARDRAWALAGDAAPGADGGLVTVDLDATIVIAHSDKQLAAPTWKKTFGFHPMTAWADHGAGGNGEPLALLLRPGNAGSDTAADHTEATRLALAQLPRRLRRKVLVRADSGGGTHEFLKWLTAKSRRLHYSIGMPVTDEMQAAVLKVPAGGWTPAYDGDGQVREGAWVADITGLLNLDGWPAGMRVIRKERPHPGAQLRFTDVDGHRFTAFATDAKKGQLADLELRHRRRARCEDRIRNAKDTGLRNLPSRASLRTRSGARSSPWPASSWPGRRCSPWPDKPAAGNPSACGCACSPPPGAWPAVAAACGSDSPSAGPGPAKSPPLSPGCRPCHPADQPEQTRRPGRRNHQGPWSPAQPARQPNSRARPASENQPQPNTQASRSRARKIEASERGHPS